MSTPRLHPRVAIHCRRCMGMAFGVRGRDVYEIVRLQTMPLMALHEVRQFLRHEFLYIKGKNKEEEEIPLSRESGQ